jgi:MFS family permease
MKNAVSGKSSYGWYIVGASLIMLFFNTGAQYAFGVMFKPIIKEFGWSRSAVSSVFLVNMVIFAIALTIVGKLYDRFGPKWIIIVSTLLISTGFILTSFVHNFGQFFLSYGLLAAAGPAGTGVPLVSTLVSKWFVKWRGLAISLALAGTSLGAFILVPLLSFAAASYGWRSSFFCLGLSVLLVNVLLALFVLKGDPHHLGKMAFGAKLVENVRVGAGSGVSASESRPSMGLREAAHTRSFWLFLGTMFICGSGDYFATTHFINIATDYGVSSLTAGKMMGWYGLMSLAGMLLTGPAADRIGSKIPIIVTFMLRFALYLFILKYKSVGSLYVFALLFGFTQLITAPLAPMLMGRLYGFGHIGIITGAVNTVHFLGGGFWPYVTSVIFDRTGSYQLAFVLSAVMALTAVVCSSFIVEKRHGIEAGEAAGH